MLNSITISVQTEGISLMLQPMASSQTRLLLVNHITSPHFCTKSDSFPNFSLTWLGFYIRLHVESSEKKKKAKHSFLGLWSVQSNTDLQMFCSLFLFSNF